MDGFGKRGLEHAEDVSVHKRTRNGPPAGVSFQPRTSIYSFTGTENEFGIDGEEFDTMEPRRWWVFVAENIYFRQFFRSISVVNLIVLAFSIPFYNLNDLTGDDRKTMIVSVQFKVVTVLDFMLTCVYTFHLFIRISYYFKIAKTKKRPHSPEWEDDDQSKMHYVTFYRTLTALLLTLSMWYSVGIGIYRSIDVIISQWWYVGFAPRAILAVFPVVNLLLKVESSAVRKLSGLLKWRQLAMVTGFYFFFVFIFALMGVHIIGGLEYFCMYRTMNEDGNYSVVPAIPLTHCLPHDADRDFYCQMNGPNNTGLVCLKYPPDGDTLFFDYRSYVYYGQYRVILDALFAVYEASTLELWSFMMYTAIDGSGVLLPIIFYLLLVFFVVILLQQSIFLVVIIESFADIRDKSVFFWTRQHSSQKGQNKPTTVLTLEDSSTTKLKLNSLKNDGSATFLNKYSKFLVIFEKVFLVLVMIDAVITASKHADMQYKEHRLALQIWQLSVSILFVMEISFVFVFHLYHGQWKLFCRRPYYICLTILAIGGLVASLPIEINGFHFYDPFLPGSALAIFQAFRFPRLLRLSQSLLDFTLKITGKSIPILCIITLIAICWLAVFNGQLFGYTTDSHEDCSRISGQHFGSFFEAFESTFQIVMNEAWTDVTSEVMCRSSYWFVTNFYFIVIHLFSSLIFLNFFGAVILDNLEYDEEEKKAKLEEIKKKEAEFNETVPYRLKIFKKLGNQPKKLKPPPGIGGEDPKLDEVEVRKFFDSANTSNLMDDAQDLSLLHTPQVKSSQSTSAYKNRKVSQLRQLSLVSSQSNDLMPSETPEFQGIYSGISSILNYISLWRKYSEEDKSKDPRSSHIHYLFGQSPYDRRRSNLRSSNVRSEYEVFKEKHRFFDMALFCMPPEHKLRRLCTKLLTSQADAPHYVAIHGKGDIIQMFKKRFLFISRWIISRMPYFSWFVFMCLFVIVTIQMIELSYEGYHPNHTYTPIIEGFYLLVMFSWLIIRVISRGCFLNPHAAISSVWDVIDWILVLDSAVFLFFLPLWFNGDYNFLSLKIEIPSLSMFFTALYTIRCLRPLHIISILNTLRAVVREIVEGWKNLVKAIIFLLGFLFMFASLGVQLFVGTDHNPLAFCNDPTINKMEECVGQFRIKIDGSREFLPLNSTVFPSIEMLVPRVWFPYVRDFPLHNVPFALVTLFELLTLEGWTEMRDIFSEKNIYLNLYIHTFVFFAVNIGLQLFLGIVVNNFNEHKPGHTFLLTVEQNRWAELMQRISLQRPDKLPEKPRNNKLRLKLYLLLTHHSYRIVPTVIIALSALTLVVPWNAKFIGESAVLSMMSLSILLNLYTVLEMFLKLLAFGPAYFQSWRNLFDFILSFPTVAYAISGLIILLMPDTEKLYIKMSYFALSISILKLITIMVKYSAMLNLLLTVLSTLLRSMSLIMVLVIMSLTYTMVGVVLFGNVRSGEAIDYRLVNFEGSGTAFSAVWRTFTGEDWYQIMWDAAVRPPYCDDEVLKNCGYPLFSVVYFAIYIFSIPFILLNVFIAVLLENFSIFYNDEETNLDLETMKDFKRKWRIFDLHARGHIPIRRVKLLLRSLELQSYYTFIQGEAGLIQERVIHNLTDDPLLLWEMEEELQQEALSFHHKSPDGQSAHSVQDEINVEFLNVLRMLAYRCEDINRRLEPQELFTRKEQEQTLQLDVAEGCILKWLRKKVKPIVKRQRERETVNSSEQNHDFPHQQSITTKEKRQQLYALHNAANSQFLDVQGWSRQLSVDTEDEDTEPAWRHSWSSRNQLLQATSEERIDYVGFQDITDESSASRSFNKIKQNYTPSSQGKAKEWFKMQEEWMDNVKTNQNYFDDHL